MTQSTDAIVAHTPGPWTRAPGQQFRADYSRGVRGPDNLYVAAALDFNRTDREDEVEANARLIAAAPDLLAIAKDWLRYERDPEWRTDKEGEADRATAGNVTFAEALLEQLEDAINKAEGREP